jgi:uncharacterized protein
MPVTGTVAALYRWPVESVVVDARGIPGDRAHAVFPAEGGRRINAVGTPAMLEWSARYPGAVDPGDDVPLPLLRTDGGEELGWGSDEMVAALTAHLGRDVALRRDPDRGFRDFEPLHVTTEATRRAAEEVAGRDLDQRRFRANLHLDLEAPAFAESGWMGRTLRVGDLALQIVAPCIRCVIPTRDPDAPRDRVPALMRWLAREQARTYGVYARPAGRGALRAGDPVVLAGPE